MEDRNYLTFSSCCNAPCSQCERHALSSPFRVLASMSAEMSDGTMAGVGLLLVDIQYDFIDGNRA